jgi:hypothetical protein
MTFVSVLIEFILPGEDKFAFGVDITLAVKHELSC